MSDRIPCEVLSDDELHTTVRRLTARSNVTLADLLVHLGEVERRGIHRLRACASLYTYCVYELRMSEDSAFRRAKAARLVREFPEVREMIATGELHLTGLLLIGPHLGGERHAEILQRARFRSKRELARLIARIDPKPDVPARVEPIGPTPAGPATHAAFIEALAGPVRTLPVGERPEDWLAEEESAVDGGEEVRQLPAELELREPESAHLPAQPERPLRYAVQFTASQEYVDLLKQAFDLLSHEMPKEDLPEVQLRAMRELVKQLRRRKRAAVERPRTAAEANEAATEPPVVAPERDHETPHSPERANEASAAPGRESARAAAAPERDQQAESGGAAPERDHEIIAAQASKRSPSRHIPAGVERPVWARDGEQCAHMDARGVRCRETRFLELHHVRPFALGGPPTVSNIEVRCKSHNTLAAERDFGRQHMGWVRGERDEREASLR